MRIRIAMCLVAGLAVAAGGEGFAGELGAAASTAAAAPAPAADEGEPTTSPWCLTATGSRIPPKEGECVPAASGRVITRDEIEKSGATSVSDAVRRLAITH